MTSVISFTPEGNALNKRLCAMFDGWRPFLYDGTFTARDFAENSFSNGDNMVFIGAAGIAVRAAAPFLKDKFKDPAVIVIDEKGRFVIPILGGHAGGGNALAEEISSKLCACAVITTSTDVNGVFAVDVFAVKNNLVIKERETAKKISAAVIKGKKIPFLCRADFEGNFSDSIYAANAGKLGFVISPYNESPFEETLHLVPGNIVLGIGCKAGVSEKQIEKAVLTVLENGGIYMESVCAAASIDIKKEEKGLLEFCRKYALKTVFYSAAELLEAKGEFSSSKFVLKSTGVDNVCERSAALFGGEGRLVVKKTALNGVAVAVFMKKGLVCFE